MYKNSYSAFQSKIKLMENKTITTTTKKLPPKPKTNNKQKFFSTYNIS